MTAVDVAKGAAITANDDNAVGTVVPPSSTKDEDAYVGGSVAFEGACVGAFADGAGESATASVLLPLRRPPSRCTPPPSVALPPPPLTLPLPPPHRQAAAVTLPPLPHHLHCCNRATTVALCTAAMLRTAVTAADADAAAVPLPSFRRRRAVALPPPPTSRCHSDATAAASALLQLRYHHRAVHHCHASHCRHRR